MEIKEELLDIHGIQNSKKNLLDLFIRRTAVLTQTSESLVDLMIKDQWRNATKVSQPGSPIAQIEFASIGTFTMSPTKARKRVKSLDNKYNHVDALEPVDDERTMQRRLTSKQRYKDQMNNIMIKTKTIPDEH